MLGADAYITLHLHHERSLRLRQAAAADTVAHGLRGYRGGRRASRWAWLRRRRRPLMVS